MIKTYVWQDKQFQNLVDAVKELQKVTGGSFKVEDVYFDYGQDWKWTTIVCKDVEYQMLNPNQQDAIAERRDFSCLHEVIGTYFDLKRKHLDLALKLLDNRRELWEAGQYDW